MMRARRALFALGRAAQLYQGGRRRRSAGFECLRRTPEIDGGNLMNAGNRAVGSAAFLRQKFAPKVGLAVLLKGNARIAALLRTVVHQPVLANVQIARAGAAAPIVFA